MTCVAHLAHRREASASQRKCGTIKVWGRPTSINTQRVRWALADSDIPHELILASATMGPNGHVSKGGAAFGIVNTAAYRAMNPNGTVPTIDDDGFILSESNAILIWLALKRALAGKVHAQSQRSSLAMPSIGAPLKPYARCLR